MKIIFINNQTIWNKLILEAGGNFLQSWAWGEFRKRLGMKVWRIAIEENQKSKIKNKKYCLLIQIEKRPLPLDKSYFYVGRGLIAQNQNSKLPHKILSEPKTSLSFDPEVLPSGPNFQGEGRTEGEFRESRAKRRSRHAALRRERGQDYKIFDYQNSWGPRKTYGSVATSPSFAGKNQKLWKVFIKEIKKLAKKEKAVFIKFEPEIETAVLMPDYLKKLGFKKSNSLQPKDTLILDIAKPEEELLSGFRQKTRYNIRLAQKKGIKIKEAGSKKELKTFWNLIKKTDKRQHIKSFNFSYYKELFKIANQRQNNLKIKFFLAYFKNLPIAGLVLVVFGRRAVYLFGASDYQYRFLMAPYLLQWEAIKAAKSLGCKEYDFWGIIKEKDFKNEKQYQSHTWHGITKFKQGFGGKIISYAGGYDYVFSSWWYGIYRLAKKLKTKN